MNLQQLLEAKYVTQKKGWLWAVEQDVKTTINAGYDIDSTTEFFNWAKDNKKTLDHLYQAFQDDVQRSADFLEDNWGGIAATGEQLVWYWVGEIDYTELAVYQQLRKILPADELDYVARIMIDVIADEIRNR